MSAPSWGTVTLIVLGTAFFLVGTYLKPKKVDVQSILNKNILRWEAPILIGLGIALNFYPIEDLALPTVAAFLVTSGFGVWMAMREIAQRKKRGEKLGDE